MRSIFSSSGRRWIGASALAVIVGLSGGASFLVASSQGAAAGTAAGFQPAAQITVPPAAAPSTFADLVVSAKPAVVSILVQGQELQPVADESDSFDGAVPDLPNGSPLRHFFDQFRKGNGNQTPQKQRFMAAGSGFAITTDGYFVTNNHVVANATKVTVQFSNGDEKPATIVGTDAKTDLAVIKVAGLTNQPFVKLDATTPRVGDWVMAMGNPFGLGGTVTAGIVSALGRNIGDASDDSYMQIDAPVNKGNSGGPDFNLQGEVVGVNTAIYSPNGGSVGIAFAIPAATVKKVSTDLIKDGKVTRGFLGVGIQDDTRDIADSVGLQTDNGAVVTTVTKGAPADQAGIKVGDIITAVDGQTIADASGLSKVIGMDAPGTTANLTIWRNGAQRQLSIKLDTVTASATSGQTPSSMPSVQDTPAVASSVGITLAPSQNGLGVTIQDIDPNSVAASKGFSVGDIILDVDNMPVNTAQAFQSEINAVKAGGHTTALVKAERDGHPLFIGLPLNADT